MGQDNTPNRLIAEIPKNSMETIRIAWSEFKGHRFLDCRVYYEDDAGEMRPTKKGIAVSPDLLPDLVAAFEKAHEELKGGENK